MRIQSQILSRLQGLEQDISSLVGLSKEIAHALSGIFNGVRHLQNENNSVSQVSVARHIDHHMTIRPPAHGEHFTSLVGGGALGVQRCCTRAGVSRAPEAVWVWAVGRAHLLAFDSLAGNGWRPMCVQCASFAFWPVPPPSTRRDGDRRRYGSSPGSPTPAAFSGCPSTGSGRAGTLHAPVLSLHSFPHTVRTPFSSSSSTPRVLLASALARTPSTPTTFDPQPQLPPCTLEQLEQASSRM